MNYKTLAFVVLAAFFMVQAGSWAAKPDDNRVLSTSTKAGVPGSVRGIADVRAQFIVQSAQLPLDPRLKKPGMRASIDAMQHPATSVFLSTQSPLEKKAFKGLRKALGLRSDGTLNRSAADLKRDPKVARALAKELAKQRAAGKAQEAAVTRATAQYAKRFGSKPRQAPMPPQTFDGVLRVFNDGTTPMTVWVDSDYEYRTVDLSGPGAVSIFAAEDTTEVFKLGREVVIAAGGHADLPVSSLTFGHRASQMAAYATQPGGYTLGFGYVTRVARPGARPASMVIQFPKVHFTVR